MDQMIFLNVCTLSENSPLSLQIEFTFIEFFVNVLKYKLVNIRISIEDNIGKTSTEMNKSENSPMRNSLGDMYTSYNQNPYT